MMRVLRERGSTAHVIVLTAYNDFDYARSALRFGAADYLLKPFPRPGARRRHRARARRPRPSPAAARKTICWRCPRATRANMCSRRSNTSPRTTPTRTSTSPPSPAPSASARAIRAMCSKRRRATPRSATSRSTASTWRAGPRRLPLQGLRGRWHGRLPRCRLLRLDLQKAHRPLPSEYQDRCR